MSYRLYYHSHGSTLITCLKNKKNCPDKSTYSSIFLPLLWNNHNYICSFIDLKLCTSILSLKIYILLENPRKTDHQKYYKYRIKNLIKSFRKPCKRNKFTILQKILIVNFLSYSLHNCFSLNFLIYLGISRFLLYLSFFKHFFMRPVPFPNPILDSHNHQQMSNFSAQV